MASDPNEKAARIERRTQRILWISGLAFLAWQLAYFALYLDPPESLRTVDKVRTFAFIAWGAALLLLVATGGGAFAGREVREILDDELARARRATAWRNGFWAMMGIAFAGYLLAHLTRISPLNLAHLTISGGILVAVLTLARLGRS